jgi:hypothetical protein
MAKKKEMSAVPPKPPMVKVRFLVTRLVRDGTGTTFTAGKVYEMTEDSAQHWIRRQKAELVETAAKASRPTTAAPVPTAGTAPPDVVVDTEAEDEADAKSLHTRPGVTPPITHTKP